MKIFDISQEIFGCAVYPGDPAPERIRLQKMSEGALYNLTAFSMCAHNGTHIDAPSHFVENGETVSQIDLSRVVGYAYVASHEGRLSASDAERILGEAASAIRGRETRVQLFGRKPGLDAGRSLDELRGFQEVHFIE